MKNIFLLFTVFFIGINISAQEAPESISAMFIAMPDNLMIGMDAEQRVQLTANPDSTKVSVLNSLDDEIVRTALTENYMALNTSEAGTMQLISLPLVNNTNIIGMIRTVCGKACDSQIEFYTTDWKPLNQSDLFPQIDKSLFLRKDADMTSQDYMNAVASLDMTPVKLTFLPEEQAVSAVYDIENYLSADDYKLAEPYLVKEPKVFKWDKFSFKP